MITKISTTIANLIKGDIAPNGLYCCTLASAVTTVMQNLYATNQLPATAVEGAHTEQYLRHFFIWSYTINFNY